jgi:Flp pilus assembly protein TadD
LADRASRCISFNRTTTIADYVERRAAENSQASLVEALRASPNHSAALARLAHEEFRLGADTNAAALAAADWLSRCALELTPHLAEVWTSRVNFLQRASQPADALDVVERALRIFPTDPGLWRKKGALHESANRLDQALPAYTAGIELSAHTNGSPNSSSWLLLDRARLLKRLGREAEALVDIQRAKNFPPRNPQILPHLLDLTCYYNARLDESWHNPNDAGNNLAQFPAGIGSHGGVDFDARGVIQLAAGLKNLQPGYPDQVCGILVNQPVRRVQFLCGTGWRAPEGSVIGRWVFHFADGQHCDKPLIYGRDVNMWQFWPTMPAEFGGPEPVWKGTQARWTKMRGYGVRLYKCTWDNPRSGVLVTSIDFVSAMAESAPFVLAITVE